MTTPHRKTTKPRLGRPRKDDEPRFSTNIYLTAEEREFLLEYGEGSLIDGVRRLCKEHLSRTRKR